MNGDGWEIEITDRGENAEGCPYKKGIFTLHRPFQLETPDKNGKPVVLEKVQMAFALTGNFKGPIVIVPPTLTSSPQINFGENARNVSSARNWFGNIVNPNKAIDTRKVCTFTADWLGGSFGTTGPNDINPETSKPFGYPFPITTVGDDVKLHHTFFDAVEIDDVLGVGGGSLGAMYAQQFATTYPEFMYACVSMAGTWGHRNRDITPYGVSQAIFLHFVREGMKSAKDIFGANLTEEEFDQLAVKFQEELERIGLQGQRYMGNMYDLPMGNDYEAGRIVEVEGFESGELAPESVQPPNSFVSYLHARCSRLPAVTPASHQNIIRKTSGYQFADISEIGHKEVIAGLKKYRIPTVAKLNRSEIGKELSFDGDSREYILRTVLAFHALGEKKLEQIQNIVWSILSYGGDGHYNPQRSAETAYALKTIGANVKYRHIRGDHGHDGFAIAHRRAVGLIRSRLSMAEDRRRESHNDKYGHNRANHPQNPFAEL